MAVCALGLWLSGCGSDLQTQRGVTPGATLSVLEGPIVDLGPVVVDTALDKTITVKNIGAQRANEITGSFYLSQNFAFAGGLFPGSGGTCFGYLDPGETCTLVIRFTPKYQGDISTLLPLSYHDGNAARTNADVTLKGKGTGAPT